MSPRKFLPHLNRRNLINLVALVLILYMSVSIIRVIAKNYQLQQEVDSLQSEIEGFKVRNTELEYEIAYYQTDAFADREARDKLGLQAPGEKVVILTDKVPPLAAEAVGDQDRAAVQTALSNLEQWLYFLFKKEPS